MNISNISSEKNLPKTSEKIIPIRPKLIKFSFSILKVTNSS